MKKKPIVWTVPGHETGSGFHEVTWAKDGDLNKAHRRGDTKRFIRNYAGWLRAKKFAHAKAKTLGIKASIHPY